MSKFNKIIYIIFVSSLQNSVCIYTYSTPQFKHYLSEIIHLYLDFIKFILEKLDGHTQVALSTLETFLIIGVSNFTLK